MGKTFKDKNKNYRFREVGAFDDGFSSQKSSKQDAKRFRQDRSSKRSVREDESVSDE